jgi:hypothetical protein
MGFLRVLGWAALVTGACGNPAAPGGPTRSYRMGFSPLPPRNDPATVLPTLEKWTRRADAGIMHVSPPWAAMLAGSSATAEVQKDPLGIANYYRGKGLSLVVMLDLTNGLDRSAEAPELVAARRSLTEPAVQALYRQYAAAIVSVIHPDYLGLAAETNLIRVAAPPALYDAVKQAANGAAAEIAAQPSHPKLLVSVQVETAWGLLPNTGGFVGVAQDLQDFPFGQALGLSSYPYAAWPEPEQIPLDYYTRVRGTSRLPLLVVEGGWTSANVSTVVSSPEKQARYIRVQARLLDAAQALYVFQLTFSDLDVAGFPQLVPSNLDFFAYLGLVDVNLADKRALEVWDSLFALSRR